MAGAALVAVVLYDVFETVVVPRRTQARWRLAPFIFLLWPLWRRLGIHLKPAWRREDFLGTFAPFALMMVLVIWVVALILGFGLVFHALREHLRPQPEEFFSAFYAAGASLLTIGFGDIVPLTTPARIVSLMAGASGLAVVALVISLTFNLYGSFARRETLVLLLDARAGAPPSGVTLLETYAEKRIVGELSGVFQQYELWTAELLDSHLAYPILPFFRSSHDGQSWISALGAVLDAATLLITAVSEPSGTCGGELRLAQAAAEMMYHMGCHALVDLTQLRLVRKRAKFAEEAGIERAEFETACQRLARAGYSIESGDRAWQTFVEHRSVYATRLNAMARYLASPPTQWIGDRTVLAQHRRQHLQG